MPAPKSKLAATDALIGLWTVALTAFVIAALYFAREFLIPLALSALLTFLLSPFVTRQERWLGRIVAVLFVVALIFSATGGAGWIVALGSDRSRARNAADGLSGRDGAACSTALVSERPAER